MTADDDVTWRSHSLNVNDYVEWTERVRVVQTDCGGPITDNIHDVVQTRDSTHDAYNIQHVSTMNDEYSCLSPEDKQQLLCDIYYDVKYYH